MAQTANDARGQRFKELVEEMKLYNNPQELEDVKKIMKKNVPLSMRGYLLAYLFVKSKHTNSPAKPVRETKPRQADVQTTSLYINVGKQSKTSAKELAKFVCTTAKIAESDIVSIAYKQNYSFLYVKNDKVKAVLDSVNGQSFNGRKVKVNYSKEKDEN